MLNDPVLLVVSQAEHPRGHRVWGSGGWLPPQEREGLDWLTLSRCLGWGVTVCNQQAAARQLSAQRQWVLLALGEEAYDDNTMRAIEEWVRNTGGTLILPLMPGGASSAAAASLAGASARHTCFAGTALVAHFASAKPMPHFLRQPVAAHGLEPRPGTEILVTIDSIPVVLSRRTGAGLVVSLGFHPSVARDADGVITALLRDMMVSQSTRPVAWIDLEGVVVLRMDDPGAAQNVYLQSWSYPELNERAWRGLARELSSRQARLSVCYCCGWVDDGDARRGRLEVDCVAVARSPGWVHPSPRVRYEEIAGHLPGTVHDYAGEYRGVQALRAAGLGDVELHGYTHQHPDAQAWAAASDRYTNVNWFRELGTAASAATAKQASGTHPIARGVAALDDHFRVRPTTLVCPGDEWTDAALAVALDCGLLAVSNYYLAIRDADRFCWSTHICAPYLDKPDASWFVSGLPVVGYFHDREPSLAGPGWLGRCLDAWVAAGARRFVDFRELNAAVTRRIRLALGQDGRMTLFVDEEGAPSLVRPLHILIEGCDASATCTVDVVRSERVKSVPLCPDGKGRGRLLL